MRKIIYAALSLLIAASCSENQSELMVRSEMARCQDASYLDGMDGKLKWNYTTGLELKAFLDVYDRYGNDDILNYVDAWYDAIIDTAGNIQTYKMSNYNVDHICPARTLFRLYDLTGKEKYMLAMQNVRRQIDTHPRTTQGGFWHKKVYPSQMWLDGLYMAQPFYAEYTARYAPEEQKDSLFRDCLNNFIVVAEHTFDPATGLYRHAWDESKEMFWCDPESGQSAHAWGRALGWYCMAMADVLEIIPSQTAGYEDVCNILRGIFDVLPSFAESESGMWYQVLDQPGREGNYLEATASAMFSYALLKGVRLGVLDSSLKEYAHQTYGNLCKEFIKSDSNGNLEMIRCCEVAGLGGKTMRSGTFDYYINESIRSNDPKGIGPFIWASLEEEL